MRMNCLKSCGRTWANAFILPCTCEQFAATRVIGYFQVQKSGNRHLVDLRPVDSLPDSQVIEGVRVLAPAELIAHKATWFHSRQGQPKGFSDMRDLAILFLTFPEMKTESGPV